MFDQMFPSCRLHGMLLEALGSTDTSKVRTRKFERSVEVVVDELAKNIKSIIELEESGMRRSVVASGLHKLSVYTVVVRVAAFTIRFLSCMKTLGAEIMAIRVAAVAPSSSCSANFVAVSSLYYIC